MAFQPFMDTVAAAQASVPTSNLSPHVDGGPRSAIGTGANATVTPDDMGTMHLACGIVLSALALLWLLGALVFSSARL